METHESTETIEQTQKRFGVMADIDAVKRNEMQAIPEIASDQLINVLKDELRDNPELVEQFANYENHDDFKALLRTKLIEATYRMEEIEENDEGYWQTQRTRLTVL